MCSAVEHGGKVVCAAAVSAIEPLKDTTHNLLQRHQTALAQTSAAPLSGEGGAADAGVSVSNSAVGCFIGIDDRAGDSTAVVEYLPGLLDQQLKRDADLGRFEYAVLLMLSRAPEHTRPTLKLSTVTFGSLSRLSHTVTRLVERGLVTRVRNGANRHVSLTPKGKQAFRAAAPGHVETIRQLVLDHLPEGGADKLVAALTPVVNHLRASAPRN